MNLKTTAIAMTVAGTVAASDPGGIGVRHRYVAVKGDFGNVYIGQTYHAFYNHVVGLADPAY
jgi:hypothetical protein